MRFPNIDPRGADLSINIDISFDFVRGGMPHYMSLGVSIAVIRKPDLTRNGACVFANMAQFRCLMQHLSPTGQLRITSQIPKVLILFLPPHFPPFSSPLIYNNREHKKFVGFKKFLTFFLFHTTTKSPILSMNSISINNSFITSIRK